MPPNLGGDFLMAVALVSAPGAISVIGDMSGYRRGSTRAETRHSVFGRTLEYVVPGRRSQTIELTGFLNASDAGQNILRTAERTNVEVIFEVLVDGQNGWYQNCKVSSFTHDATPDDLQTHGFTLIPTADAVIIGTGPLL